MNGLLITGLLACALLFGAASASARTPWPAGDHPFEDYPIIIYSVDPHHTNVLEELRDAGVTTIQTYQTGWEPTDERVASLTAHLDALHELGMDAVMEVDARRKIDREDREESLQALLDAYGSHPAIRMITLADEPDNHNVHPEQLVWAYDLIKRSLPDIPLANTHAWSRNWYAYKDVQDVMLIDNYPVMDEAFPSAPIDNMTRFTAVAIEQGQPVIPVMQIINWAGFAGRDQREIRGRNVEDCRFPNEQELVYWYYATLAQGASGAAWYSYHWTLRVDDGAWFKTTFLPVTREFSDFVNQIRTAHTSASDQAAPNPISMQAVWLTDEHAYGVLINNTSKPKEVSVRLLLADQFDFTELTLDARDLQVNNLAEDGILSLEMQPWEVLIWSAPIE